MRKKKSLKWLIGLLCALLVLAVAFVALYLDSQSPDPIFGIFPPASKVPGEGSSNSQKVHNEATQGQSDSAQEQENASSATDSQVVPPEDLPPIVEILPETDPETGENQGISFPCQVPGYGLVIEKIAPYSGMFVEDGTNVNVDNVAMLLVSNEGDYPVEYTQICVAQGQEELLFDISALPVGEKLVVQEKNGKPVAEDKIDAANVLVVQRADMQMSEDQIRITDNGDNTMTIENMTEDTIPTVRVFYKHYMEQEALFVGGIAFTVRITRLGAGASITIQPSHYTSQNSRVVMALTYDSEV